MPHSPSSRRLSRRLSNNGISSPNSPVLSHSRRSSQYSFVTRYRSHRYSVDSSGLQDNSIENLADELADVWASDDDVCDGISEMKEDSLDNSARATGIPPGNEDCQGIDKDLEYGLSTANFPANEPLESLTNQTTHSKGLFEDVHVELSDTLNAIITDIDNLAKQGAVTEFEESHDGNTAQNFEFLQDLGAQSGIETCTMRLAKAQTAVSANLTNQTRALKSLSYALLSPVSMPLSQVAVDELLNIIMLSAAAMPQPNFQAVKLLKNLYLDSHDTIRLLKELSDALHMLRQTADAAARRLRSAREQVAELTKEYAAFENGRRWIEEGDWPTRLADRDCAKICKDVVQGFEEACNHWREQIVASAA